MLIIENMVAAMGQSSQVSYLNVENGEIILLNEMYEDALRKFEELPETAGDAELYEAFGWKWADPEFLNFLRNRDQYKKLPGRWEINEYRVMRNFIATVEDDEQRNTLLMAIRGSGAFRRFKETTHRFGLQGAWYDFKKQHLTWMAQEWCIENGLAYDGQDVQ